MSVQSSTPKLLENTDTKVFFEKPKRVIVNEDARSKYASSHKIETLLQDLKNGPLVALGRIGPGSYEDAPFKLKDKMNGQEIYGWKPGAKRLEASEQSYLIVLGARKEDSKEHVFFTLSVDITKDQSTAIRDHIPSPDDPKIYVVSHEKFKNYLFDLYPSASSIKESATESDEKVASSTKVGPKTSAEKTQADYVKELSSLMPLASILDRQSGEAKCKAIGQEIFDNFKKQANGYSEVGKEALQSILEAVSRTASDGKLRKQYIERAWNHVGDSTSQWLS